MHVSTPAEHRDRRDWNEIETRAAFVAAELDTTMPLE
jgi:hypothetical protein